MTSLCAPGLLQATLQLNSVWIPAPCRVGELRCQQCCRIPSKKLFEVATSKHFASLKFGFLLEGASEDQKSIHTQVLDHASTEGKIWYQIWSSQWSILLLY